MSFEPHTLADLHMMRILLGLSLMLGMVQVYGQTSPLYHNYISQYGSLAVAEMQRTGIPASIKMAQALLESGAGTSTLAREANNHFGIKCHNGWTGEQFYREDDDRNERGQIIASCFRKYDHESMSYADHSSFLTGSVRYAALFTYDPHDYQAWARGLKRAGYATAHDYADRLISIIENYELHLLDQGTIPAPFGDVQVLAEARSSSSNSSGKPAEPSKPAKPAKEFVYASINDVRYTEAKAGETLGNISARSDVSEKILLRYNPHLVSRHNNKRALDEGQRVFLQPRRKQFRGRDTQHRVSKGQSMQDIADLYGLQVDMLRRRNDMTEDREPKAGQIIYTRGKRTATAPITMSSRELAAIKEEMSRPRPSDSNGGNANTASASASVSISARPAVNVTNVIEVIVPEPLPGHKPAEAYSEASGHGGSRPQGQLVSQIEVIEKPAPSSKSSSGGPAFETVKPGDTLYAISRRTGVSVPNLKSYNGLADNTIKVGQKLRLQP